MCFSKCQGCDKEFIKNNKKQKFCSLSCSVSSKNRIEKVFKTLEYNKNPKKCKGCETILVYERRMNKFCSSSCSTTHNNLKRSEKKYCGECGVEIKNNKNRSIFCSIKCSGEQRRRLTFESFLKGEVKTRRTIKRILYERDGHKCSVCNLTMWRNKKIPLEVDHQDGNASNNMPNNLRLLCPNCHAQQPTSKGSNRGKGRKSLGLSLG
jgi:5-methylcytosine-specific restriction endonuclease McrA